LKFILSILFIVFLTGCSYTNVGIYFETIIISKNTQTNPQLFWTDEDESISGVTFLDPFDDLSDYLIISSNGLFLNKDIFQVFTDETISLIIVTNINSYEITLLIIDTVLPYANVEILSFDSTSNVYVPIDLMGGRLKSISGHQISTSDYRYRDGMLVIQRRFFRNIMNNQPELNEIILSYLVESPNGDIHIGYLTLMKS
jgi:hypothetical protein